MKKVDDLLESYMGIRDTELGEYTEVPPALSDIVSLLRMSPH